MTSPAGREPNGRFLEDKACSDDDGRVEHDEWDFSLPGITSRNSLF